MNPRIVGLILLVVMTATGAFGQTTGTQGPAGAGAEDTAADGTAADTEPEGTPLWARNLRRAEIIATGSFPLTLLAARLIYSLLRFAVRSLEAGAIDVTYAPWFLAPPGSPELVFNEKLGIVAGAAGFSMLIALIDYRRGTTEDEQEP